MKSTQKQLVIELRSDLCPGSGLSYTGVVDSDVVYDEAGLPYIPARRLKGCMREAAVLVANGDKNVEKLFGYRGANEPGRLQIGNAELEKAEALKKEIGMVAQLDGMKALVAPSNMIKLYTSERAQTRIDPNTGSAMDNTLRVTRVVNQFDPLAEQKGQNLCFYADISWDADSDEEAEDMQLLMEKTAKAVRNIGMNRNRGLGSVRCRLQDVNKKYESDNASDLFKVEMCGDDLVKISYKLKNTAPLILSEKDEASTVSHITGKSILGAFAGAYIQNKLEEGAQNPADTEEFRDLFLNGTVIYANAYPVFNELRTYPAPLYLNKLKKTKQYVNLLVNDDRQTHENGEDKSLEQDPEDAKYNTADGNQPKLLREQYVVEEFSKGNKISYGIKEVEHEIAFHHRHEQEGGDKAILYSLEYLKSGQEFIGEIYTPTKYVSILSNLLISSKLRFGKSRAAQYGTCELVPFISSDSSNFREEKFSSGTEVVVTLKSDGIFMNDDGDFTVCFQKVKELLAEKIGLVYKKDVLDSKSVVHTKEVVGYNTTWNMKRPAVPAVCAGSALVYTLDKDLNKWPDFVGVRTQEGYGEIEIRPLCEMSYRANKIEEKNVMTKGEISPDMEKAICYVSKDLLVDQMMLSAIGKNYGLKNSSQIERITLMLKESLIQHPQNPDGAASDFWKRILSIKTDSVRNAAKKLAEATMDTEQGGNEFVDPGKMRKMLAETEIGKVLDQLDGQIGKEKGDKLLKEIWGEYLMQYLTQLKYKQKTGGN